MNKLLALPDKYKISDVKVICKYCKNEDILYSWMIEFKGVFQDFQYATNITNHVCYKCRMKRYWIRQMFKEKRLEFQRELRENRKMAKAKLNPDKYNFIKSETKTHYETYCLHSYPKQYHTIAGINENHRDCKVCNIVKENTKAKSGLTQDDVSKLFVIDREKYRNYATNNLDIRGNKLMHYRTIESQFIYSEKDKEFIHVSNTQCFALGFANCPYCYNVKHSLPLTAINNLVGRFRFSIDFKILDYNDNYTLITFEYIHKEYKEPYNYKDYTEIRKNMFVLYGVEDGGFLCEIPKPCFNISDALESLKPLEIKFAKPQKVKRQGDIFFLEIDDNEKIEKPLKQYYESYCLLDDRNLDYWEKQKMTREEIIKAIKTQKPIRQLRRFQILKTNHEATEIANIGNELVYKGNIIHSNRQHDKFILDNWHRAHKNRAVQSWQITRSSGGFD